MDTNLHDGIIEIAKSYGLIKIGDNDNKIIYSKDTLDLLIDKNLYKVSIFNKGNLIIDLNKEHLSLNSVCSVLANI